MPYVASLGPVLSEKGGHADCTCQPREALGVKGVLLGQNLQASETKGAM